MSASLDLAPAADPGPDAGAPGQEPSLTRLQRQFPVEAELLTMLVVNQRKLTEEINHNRRILRTLSDAAEHLGDAAILIHRGRT